jgi:hypothetical protein
LPCRRRLFDKSARKDDTFSRDDFAYDHGAMCTTALATTR